MSTIEAKEMEKDDHEMIDSEGKRGDRVTN